MDDMYKPSLVYDILVPTEYFKDLLPGMLFSDAEILCESLGYTLTTHPVVTRDYNARRIQVECSSTWRSIHPSKILKVIQK